MVYSISDTIVAVASAADPAPRGIIRLSGETCREVLCSAFPELATACPGSGQRPWSTKLSLPIGGQQVAAGRLLVWPGRSSYTRQPAAEFHLLGAPVLLQLAVEAFCRAGARLANPGEFTLRAFLSGRIDLTQAEAVLGLIDAESESAFQTALRQSSGGLAAPFVRLRDELMDLLAELEATLDFIDQDIEFISRAELEQKIRGAEQSAGDLASQIASRRELVKPAEVVLAGAPNAGKSSLFNRMVGSELAITSPLAGTTRDSLRCRMESRNQVWELFDTAGLEPIAPRRSETEESSSGESSAEISAAAQSLACSQARTADVLVWCVPAAEVINGLIPQVPLELQQVTRVVRVATKIDQLGEEKVPAPWLATSSLSGAGIELLLKRLSELAAESGLGGNSEVMPATAVRCAEQIRFVVEALGRARTAAAEGWGEELVAAELRTALDSLGQIAGTVYNEEILGRIFSRFCIGK